VIRDRWLLNLLLALAPLAAPMTTSIAVAQDTLSAEKMWSLTRLGDTDISPDGRLAVVSVTRFDVKKNKSFTDLWLIAPDGSSARPLTSDPAPDSAPFRNEMTTRWRRSTELPSMGAKRSE
jgi:dipeptidyl aminopeptidase/acylaminoacyl peptidase